MNKLFPRVVRFAVMASLALVLPARALLAQARTGTITGRVTEAAGGAPVASAQVTISGTTIGALTNAEGRYTLRNVPAGAAVVRSARIGYAEVLRQVNMTGGETLTLDLSLNKVAVALTPIVATATGEQARLEIPNQISQIDAVKTLETSQVSNIGDLLIAKAAGVQILQGSGVNAASRIRIRGTSSISLSNDPIIFVDGVRINSSTSGLGTGGAPASRLNDINPEDIETMDVIRGPAASATYGTDAATGVIVITTKRGRAGNTRWNFYTEQGITQDRNKYPLAYTAWGKLRNQTNPAQNGVAADCTIATIANNSCAVDSITTFNVWDDPYTTPLKQGERKQYGISVSGGSEAVNYFVALEQESMTGTLGLPKFEKDRFRAQGIPIREEWDDVNTFQRFSIRSNLDVRATPTLQIPIRSYFLSSQQQAPQDGNNTIGLGSSIYGGAGTKYKTLAGDTLWGYRQFKPGDIFQQYNNIDVQRWIGSVSPTWTPTTWLSARSNAGLDYLSESFDNVCLRDQCPNFNQTRLGFKNTQRSRQFQWTADASATASFRPLSWASTRTTAGFQFIHRQDDAYTANGSQLPPGGTTLSQASVASVNEATTVSKTAGVFVEQNAQLFDKIDAVVSVRGDQNSAFGKNFGTAYYPRAGLSYRMSEETWFPLQDKINLFRLRSSWGQAGLRPGTTSALQFYASNAYREVAADLPGLIYSTLGNANLRPETVTEIEGGFDMGFFDDRITTSITYYNKKSSDAIISATLAPSLGTQATTRSVNIGAIRNSGWEYLLTARPVQLRQLGWDFTVNGSYNSNEVLDLGGQPAGTGAVRNAVGYPINSIWDRGYTYSDANGNGMIEQSEVTVDADPRYVGYSTPRAELSIQNGFDVLSNGQLRFTFLVDGKFGGLVDNVTERFRCASRNNSQERVDPSAPLDRQARCVAFLKPAPLTSNLGYYEKTDYWRLREVAATWRVPGSLVSKLKIAKSTTITLSGRNLKLWSDFTGVDPETTSSVGNTQAEFQVTPPLQTWTLRFNFGY